MIFQNCKENTSGPSCNICASGYYGNPTTGIPCRPCKCPSAEKNYAGKHIYEKHTFHCRLSQNKPVISIYKDHFFLLKSRVLLIVRTRNFLANVDQDTPGQSATVVIMDIMV